MSPHLIEDMLYTHRLPFWTRMFLRVFRRPINSFCKTVAVRAYDRGLLSSPGLHSVCGIIDHSLWPERYKADAIAFAAAMNSRKG